MNSFMLIGKTTAHLRTAPNGTLLHLKALKPFLRLQKRAHKAGFNLQSASGFRSYERQLLIWKAKLEGKRPLWNHEGTALLDIQKHSAEEILWAILRWSAIPGCSRHHWGSDLDIYDANALSLQQLQLIPSETTHEGAMGAFYYWLDELLERDCAEGFFRPYNIDCGGIAPERWHLSYRPVSSRYQRLFSFDFFYHLLQHSYELGIYQTLLENKARMIYDRFVMP